MVAKLINRVGLFLNNMDSKAITSILVSVVLLAFVITMFVFGQQWIDLSDETALKEIMDGAASSRWSIFVVISVYALLALTGFPQFLLITATVLTFGCFNGAIYSWVATMVSGTFTFGLGYAMGQSWVQRFGGEHVKKSMAFLARRGVAACALVRVVPSAPFIVVNSAAGAAQIPIWKFWFGTGLGIIPKILLVATLGSMAAEKSIFEGGIGGLVEFFTAGDAKNLALLALVIIAWLGFLLLVRRFYVRLQQEDTDS